MDEQLTQKRARLPPAARRRARSRSCPTKQLTNQRDLALAYSPGVAAACEAIVARSGEARHATPRAATWSA